VSGTKSAHKARGQGSKSSSPAENRCTALNVELSLAESSNLLLRPPIGWFSPLSRCSRCRHSSNSHVWAPAQVQLTHTHMATDSAVSPEPGSFPKRRPAAVSRLAVPNEAGEAPQQPCTGIPSCRSDAAERGSWPRVPTPPLSASSHWRAPRLSKPGYQVEPVVYHKLWSAFCLLLLVAVASLSNHRQRQSAAVLSSVQQQHRVSEKCALAVG
jgi:hypothetical protein